jgi:hypothetical protein
MDGDILLAGLRLTAEEWGAFDAETREILAQFTEHDTGAFAYESYEVVMESIEGLPS